jgi:(p)ppGpp synthase/HD superfamily hydrolase
MAQIWWGMENPVQLTPRFTQAVDYARQVHVSLRKGTQVPYMAHLLGVASLVPGESAPVESKRLERCKKW